MARLDDPSTGRVLIDGIDVRDLALSGLARTVGVVAQETCLLHGTIRESLRHAEPDATDAELVDAARRAPVHDLVRPRGLTRGRVAIADRRP